MKSRYLHILYVGMAFAALAVLFYCMKRINRLTLRNPIITSPANTALSAEVSDAPES